MSLSLHLQDKTLFGDQGILETAVLGNGSGLHGVSAPSAATAVAISPLTFTTGGASVPAVSGEVIVASGSSLTSVEECTFIKEAVDQINKLRLDHVGVRTSLATLVGASGVLTASVYRNPTSKQSNASDKLLKFTYTTNAPAFTINGTVTIAAGATTTAAEAHEFWQEWNKVMAQLRSDLTEVQKRVNYIVINRKFVGLTAVPAVVAPTSLTVSYSATDPALSLTSTIVISNTASITSAERNRAIAELKLTYAALKVDILALRTTLAAYMAKVGL